MDERLSEESSVIGDLWMLRNVPEKCWETIPMVLLRKLQALPKKSGVKIGSKETTHFLKKNLILAANAQNSLSFQTSGQLLKMESRTNPD